MKHNTTGWLYYCFRKEDSWCELVTFPLGLLSKQLLEQMFAPMLTGQSTLTISSDQLSTKLRKCDVANQPGVLTPFKVIQSRSPVQSLTTKNDINPVQKAALPVCARNIRVFTRLHTAHSIELHYDSRQSWAVKKKKRSLGMTLSLFTHSLTHSLTITPADFLLLMFLLCHEPNVAAV